MTMAEDASNRPQAPTDRDRNAVSALSSMPAGAHDPSVGNHSDNVNDRARNRNGRGVVTRGGHEGGFVQPSSYLRPRGQSIPMTPAQPERAVDRDERLGLVSSRPFFSLTFSFPVIPSYPGFCSSHSLPFAWEGWDPNPPGCAG